MVDSRPKTIFCDIDGTLIYHNGTLTDQVVTTPKILEGVREKLNEWDRKGYNIILTTGRRESLRKVTEEQLTQLGIIYDQMIMGLGGGSRVLINDLKTYSDKSTAVAINLKRNEGIKNVEV